MLQLGLQLELLQDQLVHEALEESPRLALSLFAVAHRRLGALQHHLLSRFVELRGVGDADLGRQAELSIADHQRPGKAGQEPLRHGGRRVLILDAAQEDSELVAGQPGEGGQRPLFAARLGNDIAFAQTALESLGDDPQQLVA